MAARANCDELEKLAVEIERGFRASIGNIDQEMINHVFAPHKMTIGQIAIHSMAWPIYFLSDPKPWEVKKWTCKPVEYPITEQDLESAISKCFMFLKKQLSVLNDELLERKNGRKGPGYII